MGYNIGNKNSVFLVRGKGILRIWLHNKMDNVSLCTAAKWLRRASVWAACKSQLLFAKQSFTLATCLLDSYEAGERNWTSALIDIWTKKTFHVPLWWLWVISVMHTARQIQVQELLLTFKPRFIVTITGSFQWRHHNNFISLSLTSSPCLLGCIVSALLLLLNCQTILTCS